MSALTRIEKNCSSHSYLKEEECSVKVLDQSVYHASVVIIEQKIDSIKLASPRLCRHHVDVCVQEWKGWTDTPGHQTQLGQVTVNRGQNTGTCLVIIIH